MRAVGGFAVSLQSRAYIRVVLRRYTIGCLLASAVLAQACQTDEGPPVVSEHGSWTVISATRGGRPTNTLDDAFFRFDTAAHTLHTNFSGAEMTVDYTRVDDVIDARGSALLNRLELTKLTDSTLAFRSEIRGTPFAFELVPTSEKVSLDTQ